MSREDDIYRPALIGRKLPILPLDNKWYRLMASYEMNYYMKQLENDIKELLKKQGRLNNEIKDLKKYKSKLMGQIVGSMDNADNADLASENKKLIAEVNNKMDAIQEQLIDIPKELNELNYNLMLETMELCYSSIAENTADIEELSAWIDNIRVELKKNVVRKQDRELKNQQIYNYMHDIFGAEVIDIFDLRYNPESEHIIK